jgi:hypothetical protein
MNVFRYIFTPVLIMFFISCSSINVKNDFIKDVKHTRFETFDWMSRPQAIVVDSAMPPENRKLLEQKLKKAVNAQLADRGMQQDSESPKLLIAYHVGAKAEPNTKEWGYGHRPGSDITVRQYSDGTIILDFVDGRTRELLWRVAAFDIEDHSPTHEKVEKTINEVVQKMLEKFPFGASR